MFIILRNKYNIESVKIILATYGYELLSREYFSTDKVLTYKDKDGYIYEQVFKSFLRGSPPLKFHKSNSYSIYNIKNWIKINDKQFELLTDNYISLTTKMSFKCKKYNCRQTFDSVLNNIMSSDYGCPYCSGQKLSSSTNSLGAKYPEIAKEWHPILNNNVTPFDITPSVNKKYWWKCLLGHEWLSSPNHRINNRKCPYCVHRIPDYNYNLLVDNPELCEEWDYSINIKNPNEYTPYAGSSVNWICKVCNYHWKAKIISRNKIGTGCPKCCSSKGEKRIHTFLKLHSFQYEIQKAFHDFKGKRNQYYHFDFYIPNINLCIEYQGEQHYKPVDFAGKGQEWAEKQFKANLKRDRIKRKYCNENNIQLLEIPYYDFDNIESILSSKLNELGVA